MGKFKVSLRQMKEKVFGTTSGTVHQQRRGAKTGISLTLAFLIVAAGSLMLGNTTKSYEVIYNGMTIGYVQDPATAEVAIAQVTSDMASWYDNEDLELNQELVFKETISAAEEVMTVEECVAQVYDAGIDLEVQGAALVVEGQEIAYTASQEEAEAVIEELVAEFTETEEGEELVDYTIQENYAIVEKDIDYPSTASTEEIVEAVKEGSETVETYVVQDGDTEWDIAVNRGMDVSELTEANPDTDLENITPGQEINLNTTEALITVEVVKETTYTKAIEYETEYVEDADMYEGEEEVVTEGVNGEKSVTSEITYVNGEKSSEDVLSTEVTKEAVNEVIKVGTKVEETTTYTTTTTDTSSTSTTSTYTGTSSGVSTSGILATAASYLGTSYSVMDCSTFTKTVYAQYGISLPGTATAQAYAGEIIPYSEAQPGDILVFPGLGHVGIYAGNGMMYHASASQYSIVYASVYTTPVWAVRP
jgi:LysM repeat protein